MKGPLVVHIGPFCDDGSIRDELKRRHPSDDSDDSNQTPKRYKRAVKKSLLAEETWLRIQGLLSSTSSLSDTTRITLSFFKEHELIWAQEENMQGASILPIAVPASEVYGMLVPRKRRLYDVLHVLEGMGVIKRSRGQLASPRQRSAHFVYYGRAGVLKRLEFIKRRVDDIKHSCVGHDESEFQRAVDEAIVQACETQSVIEHWPHLSSTTVVLLSMLLCSDDTSENIAISDICHRLAEVRYDLEDPANYKAAIADVNRRVYDVASVLASCNLVLLSTSPLLPHIVRKGVRFNHGVFTSSDLIQMGEACSCYPSHWHVRPFFPGRRKTDQVAETWDSPAGSEMASFGATHSSPTLPTVYSDGKLGDLFPSPNCWSDSAITMDEWWSTSVRDLVLRDALPDADFLDWEIMQALARERKPASKQSDVSCSANFSPGQIDEYSLICDEVLADDDSDVGIDSQC